MNESYKPLQQEGEKNKERLAEERIGHGDQGNIDMNEVARMRAEFLAKNPGFLEQAQQTRLGAEELAQQARLAEDERKAELLASIKKGEGGNTEGVLEEEGAIASRDSDLAKAINEERKRYEQ